MIEILPVPFTTEAKRLLLIVPITRGNAGEMVRFLDYWFTTTTDYRQNTTNLLITIIQAVPGQPLTPDSLLLSPAEADDMRALITSYNNGSHHQSTNISTILPRGRVKVGFAIVSLRPTTHIRLGILEHFGQRGLLKGTTVVVFLEPNLQLGDDFLNRVRMNTIPGNQVFSPIPFQEYHPHLTKFKAPLQSTAPVALNKEHGYFNSKEFRIISFYYADYLDGNRNYFQLNLTKFIQNS